jgi:hypothetical protein
VITIGGARWIAVDSLMFVNEPNPRRKLGFQVDARGEIARSVIRMLCNRLRARAN